MNKHMLGHIIAFSTILVWSLTFVQTKYLLNFLNPAEILIIRFFLAWLVFFVFFPKIIFLSLKDEFIIFLSGATGIFGYYILENIALKYTSAINVGLIVTTSPIFTAFLLYLSNKNKKIQFNILGLFLVISGLFFLEKNKITSINIGDLLALGGAISFAFYSFILSKIKKDINIYLITRKSFFYGLILFLAYFMINNMQFNYHNYLQPKIFFNLFTLAFFASFLCFLMWKVAISIIGAGKTSNYIYLVPIINTLAAYFILNETIYLPTIIAIIFIILGLIISQKFGI